jgi:UDPglucose 6-dehydrogenase
MNICVFGLWHLGTVTAACLAEAGYQVMGLDADSLTIENLSQGQPPLFEPGLAELIKQGLDSGRLSFTTHPAKALAQADLVWITIDTPVDENDQADVAAVMRAIEDLFPYLPNKVLVLISSQLPVGSTRRLEKSYTAAYPAKQTAGVAPTFAYSPENLRLGKAINVFKNSERVILGVRHEADRPRLAQLFSPFTACFEWMSVESAEMTKHAINAFLATSVVFINELATLCEQVGADAKEVERGLKSEGRIGPKAYLAPGASFAGGTLARDISFLIDVGQTYQLPTHLFAAVRASNEAHKMWIRRKLQALLNSLKGKQVTVLGLTYKPGTDTLRRSSAIELCRWLNAEGAIVHAYDPAIQQLPVELTGMITLHSSAQAALNGADAAVIATEWPELKVINQVDILQLMKQPVVLDPNRILASALENHHQIRYATVGKSL